MKLKGRIMTIIRKSSVEVHALPTSKLFAESVEIQTIFPRENFVVPVAELPAWFGEYGHCIEPVSGRSADIVKVRWVNEKVASWAKTRCKRDQDGIACQVRICTLYDDPIVTILYVKES